jgi:ADP-heptose:LPS heptosyltransferase/GT2 family glycosyltransferase
MDQDFPVVVSDTSFLIEVEQPASGGSLCAGGRMAGHGWVLARERVLSVTVHLEGVKLCQAAIGIVRADVAKIHPDYPGSDCAGFAFTATLPAGLSGQATLRFDVRTTDDIHIKHVPVTLSDAIAGLGEVAGLEPIRLQVEAVQVDPTGQLHVGGWTVSVQPTQAVEVLLAGRSLGLAKTLLPRDDIAHVLGAYPNAGNAGFQFDARVELADDARPDVVTVVVTDAAGRTRMASSAVELPSRRTTRSSLQLPPMLARIEEARVSDRGILRVGGWALSFAAIDEITVFLDSLPLGVAEASLPRDDVRAAHPEYPNGASSGFLLQQEIPDGVLADTTVRVVVTAIGGIRRELTAPLAMPPVIRRVQDADIVHFFFDAVSLAADGALSGNGWAVCPSGVESISLMIGDHDAGQAEVGFDRPDVGNHFPTNASARKAGFRFTTKLPAQFEGEHTLQILVRGKAGEERVVLHPVQAQDAPEPGREVERTVERPAADVQPIRFYVETPNIQSGAATQPVRGFLSIAGWAIAPAGIEGVDVFIDGAKIGRAYYGTRREDVQAAYPDIPGALRCGFAMIVPPNRVRPGAHQVSVVFRDRAGGSLESSFTIDAEPGVEQGGPWLLRHKVPFAEVRLARAIVESSGIEPDFTLAIQIPSGPKTDARLLRTLRSLERQVADGWRALLLTSSPDLAARRALVATHFGHLADRLEVIAPDGAASLASLAGNRAASFFVLLAAGDELGSDAIMELAVEAAMHPACDLIYSDERRSDPADGVLKAFFKPDWSPELQAGTNYIGRVWAARADLIARTVATVAGLAEHGEYDLVLRLTEGMTGIRHLTRVLCQRGSRDLDAPGEERSALERAGRRRGREAVITPGCIRGTWRAARPLATSALVSIIIPTMASRDLVRLTIASIRGQTTYRHFEIVCLDNIPADNAPAKAWLREHSDTIVTMDAPFNWSRFNNAATAQARGEILLFLNDDIEVIEPDWLGAMVEIALRPEVGVVGPQLLYPDRKVQHAGMFLAGGIGRHAFRFAPHDEPGPFGLALTQREVSSVTGACMMVRRCVFDQLGGFDEEHRVVNNDVDFCLRAGRAGYGVVYTPHASLIHHEMASREHIKDVFHATKFAKDWGLLFANGDPFFHHRLAQTSDDYLPEPEPVEILHVGHPLFDRDQVKRILVVKVDHIGDFLTAVPAIRLLKTRFPQAEISVLCARASLPIAKAMPEIAEAIEFNLFHIRSEKGIRAVLRAEWEELRTTLTLRRFDIAIDLRLQPNTRAILSKTGARLLAGFAYPGMQETLDIALEWEGDSPRTSKRTHVVDRFCELVEAVSVAGGSERAGFSPDQFPPADPAILAQLAAFRCPDSAASGRTLVCIHPGVGNAARQWPATNFAALADMFIEQDRAGVVLIGGPDEAKVAARVLAAVRDTENVLSLVGKTRVSDLPGVLLACDLYVGNNSGPKHLAAALGLPTLGIHSGVVDAAEWGPFGPLGAAIRRHTTCSPCYLARRSDCPRGMTCLDDLRPGAAYDAAKRLLAARPKLAHVQ